MIDLHIHTIYSDGNKTLDEVLKMCQEMNLDYISITDHNTCNQYKDIALEDNMNFTGKIIKGCELNAVFKKRAIEILAYNINNTDIITYWLEKYYSIDKIKENTKVIYNRFLSILDRNGIIYDRKNIRKQKTDAELIERPIWEEIIKHPENKNIIGNDYFKSLQIFYRKEITNPSSEYFLNRASTFPKVEDVINIIHQAGGKAFLAHPFEYRFANTTKFIDDLNNIVNLDGVECFHPSANESEMQKLVDYCRKNRLYISGGSDYHGELKKPGINIGVGRGNLNISKEIVEEWINN